MLKNKFRNRAYYRETRIRAIKRKKHKSNIVYGFDWYRHDGQYSKGKIYCGCGLCKFGKKFGLPTIREQRDISREMILRKDFEESFIFN